LESFVKLILNLDSSQGVNQKTQYLIDYFQNCSPSDGIWALTLLAGKKKERGISTKILKSTALQMLDFPTWLFEESYSVVGDLAETIAKILPVNPSFNSFSKSLACCMQEIIALKVKSDLEKEDFLKENWLAMNYEQRLVWNKLLTGGFRTGVSIGILSKALAKVYSMTLSQVQFALSGSWDPTQTDLASLMQSNAQSDFSKPYPFCLAHTFQPFDSNINLEDFQVEWKLDGIRAQLIKRENQIFIWSRGQEIITERFPELISDANSLPNGVVLDGEIVAWDKEEQKPQPFIQLQKRINKQKPSNALLFNVPVCFVAYDILEVNSTDLRDTNLVQRMIELEKIIQLGGVEKILKSQQFVLKNIQDLENLRAQSYTHAMEGLMLKHKQMPYASGRKAGVWYKWKCEPKTIDAVLIYAQGGHGKRANLYSDFTFAIKQGDSLLTVAKAYSGLTNKELEEINKFIKSNTIQKFGPVKSVKPELVFEIGFEAIYPSTRHKIGFALRFPRILRWRKDKTVNDIDTIETLKMQM
jgi:DNA ligase-1